MVVEFAAMVNDVELTVYDDVELTVWFATLVTFGRVIPRLLSAWRSAGVTIKLFGLKFETVTVMLKIDKKLIKKFIKI